MKTEIRGPTGIEVLKDNNEPTPGGKAFRRQLRKVGSIQSKAGSSQKTKAIGRQLPLSDRALRRQKAKLKGQPQINAAHPSTDGTLFGTGPLGNRGR